MAHLERIVVLVDMDCFYCQVEEKLNPQFKGKPLAVVQYNAWKGGGIIAVNYPARDRGVTRHMRGDEAKGKCPEIILCRVPNVRGKADLTKYREAGKRVAEVLQKFTPTLERASVDEAYLDITEAVNKRLENMATQISKELLPNTYIVESTVENFLYNVYNDEIPMTENLKLAMGAVIVEEIRAAVYSNTGYRCSAGIAHNKILAKLCCGMNKPNKQTVLPQNYVSKLYENLSVRKIKSLGGKFGNSLTEDLEITNMGELMKFSRRDLLQKYDEKTANWLFNIARGIDLEPVTLRLISKSIGCCKKFPGRTALLDEESVKHWLSELSQEIAERLEKDTEENNRRAKQIVIGFVQGPNNNEVSSSRSCALNTYEAPKISSIAYEVLRKYCQKSDGSFLIKFLGLSVGKFEDCRNINSVANFFQATANCTAASTKRPLLENSDNDLNTNDSNNVKKGKSDISSYFVNKTVGKNEDYAPNPNELDSPLCEEKFFSDGLEILKSFTNCTTPSTKRPLLENSDNNLNTNDLNNVKKGKSDISSYFVSKTVSKNEDFAPNPSESDSPLCDEGKFFADGLEILKSLTDREEMECDDENLDPAYSEDTAEIEYHEDELEFYDNYLASKETSEQKSLKPSEKLEESPPESKSFFMKYKLKLLAEKRKETSDDSEDSIGNELFCSNQQTKKENVDSKSDDNSYFVKHYANMKKASPEVASPVKRDFNTSRILTENELRESSDEEIIEAEQKSKTESELPEALHFPSSSHHEGETNFLKEKCSECGKNVSIFEMSSHMDYHFALKIVREESKLYQKEPPKIIISNDSKGKSAKSTTKNAKKKNKSPIFKSSARSIASFLHVTRDENVVENVSGDTKICPECNKNVPEGEFANHMDFHAARKLHLELNSLNMNNVQMKQTAVVFPKAQDRDCNGKSKTLMSSKKKCDNRSKKIVSTTNSLTSFFKPI